jgi:hypothetical protein
MGLNPPKDPKGEDLEIIDVRWKVSGGDAEGVRDLYPCAEEDEDGQTLERRSYVEEKRTWIEWTSTLSSFG